MEEIWKDIIGYEGIYQISNLGRVLALPKIVNSSKSINGKRITSARIKCTRVDRYGYETVKLTDSNSVYKHYTIHRLVALSFIPNPNNYPSINHKDENKLNNTPDNLEWCTVKYNNLYNDRQDKINLLLTNGLLSKPVIQYSLDGVFVREFPSVNQVCRELNIFKAGVSGCCNNRASTYKGFKWSFKN